MLLISVLQRNHLGSEKLSIFSETFYEIEEILTIFTIVMKPFMKYKKF